MSIKTTLTNPPTIALIALQIIGGLLILASIIGFRSGGMLWPMLGSGAGTWLVILGWERTREKLAALQEAHLTSNRETAESRDRRQLDLFGNEIMFGKITKAPFTSILPPCSNTLTSLTPPRTAPGSKKNFEQRSKRNSPKKSPKLHGVGHDAGVYR